MIREEDQIFARVVARHNLLPPEAIAEGLRALEGDGATSLRDVFVERGLLTRAQVAELERVASRVMQGGPIPGYELVRRIGRGGMGAVYEARQLSMSGRRVALKVVRLPLGHDRRAARRLLQEAKLIGTLDHPNIVRGYDTGIAADYAYFVMEYVEGGNLRERLAERRLPVAEALRVTRAVASALAHAHERGIVHRDVKPGNILFTEDGAPKLTDLGLAKSPRDSTLTRSGTTLGTPQYIAPEQAKSPRTADARSDIYSLGATLYHMLTGIPPYQGDTLASVISQVLFEDPVPAEDLNPQLGPGVGTLLDKMMVKDPERRYPDAQALLRDLDAVIAGEAIEPVPDAPRGAASGSRRGVWVAAALVFALVAAFAVSRLGPRGSGGGTDGEEDAAAGTGVPPLLVEIRALEREFPPGAIGPERLVAAWEAWRTLADAFPESETPARSMRALELRFEGAARSFYQEQGGRARGKLVRGELGAAVEAFERGVRVGFRDRFGLDRRSLPDRWRRIDDVERRAVGESIRSEVSRRVRERRMASIEAAGEAATETAGEAATEGGRPGVREALEELVRVEAQEEAVREEAPLLGAEDRAALDARLAQARSGAEARLAAAVDRVFTLVERALERRRLASAARGLEALPPEARLARIGATERRDLLRQRLAAAAEEEREAASSKVDAAIASLGDAVSERDYDAATAALEAARTALSARADEVPGIDEELARLAPFDRGLELLADLFRRVGASVEAQVGRTVRLDIGDRNEKKILSVDGERIRFEHVHAPGSVRTASVHDLTRDEVLDRVAGSGGRPEDRAAIAWFLTAEAWAEVLENPRGADELAGRAISIVEGFASGERGSGARLGLSGLRALLARVRARVAGTRDRIRALAEAELARADREFRGERWVEAAEGYAALASRPLLGALEPQERRTVEERRSLVAERLRVAELRSRFAGKVDVLDAGTRHVRVTYEFEDDGELVDFEVPRGWFVREGALVEPDRETTPLSGRKGLVYRHAFTTVADLTLYVELAIREAETPLYFIGASLHGNSFGVLSGSSRELRQLNFFRGPLETYESAFHIGDRGFRRPPGLVDAGPRIEPGETVALRYELRSEGSKFRFFFDDQRLYDTVIGFPERDGPIEVRTFASHAIRRFVVEGRLAR